MMEFSKMTDDELLERVYDYIHRLNQLMLLINRYQDGKIELYPDIRADYSCLKSEMKEDAHYLRLKENKTGIANNYLLFSAALIEAGIKGFSARISSKVDQKFVGSIYDAEDYLQYHLKHYILEKMNQPASEA